MWKLSVSNPIAWSGSSFRVIGAEIFQAPGGTPYNLIQVQPGTQRVILDRTWCHGTADTELVRCMWFGNLPNPNSLPGPSFIAAVNGALTDAHCAGNICSQSGGFNADTGVGNYKIWNNYLESGGGPVSFGGGGNSYGTPTDILVANNDFYKPVIWNSKNAAYVPNATGKPWQVTNHFETKNSIRNWVTHNTMVQTWGGFSQAGWAILLTAKAQTSCTTCQVTDVVVDYNKIDSMAGPYQIANAASDNGTFAFQGLRYSIHDDLDINIGYTGCSGTCGTGMLQMSSGQSNPASFVLQQIVINHVTMVMAPGSTTTQMIILGGLAPPNQAGMGILNSIMPYPQFGVRSVGGLTDCSQSQLANGPLAQFNNCWAAPYQFTANLIANSGGTAPAASKWPTGNFFVASQSAIGFVDMSNGNYKLLSTSIGHNAATDGRDIGADISRVAK